MTRRRRVTCVKLMFQKSHNKEGVFSVVSSRKMVTLAHPFLLPRSVSLSIKFFIHPHCGTLHFHECGATEIFCPYSASGIATPPPRPLRPLCPPDLSMLPKSAEYLGIRHFLTLKSDATSATWVKQRPERRSLMQFPICDVVWFVKFSRFGLKEFTNRGERKRKLTQIIVRFRLEAPLFAWAVPAIHTYTQYVL